MYSPSFIKSINAPTVAGLILELKKMNPTDAVAICEIVSVDDVIKQTEKNYDVDGLDVVWLAEEVSLIVADARYNFLSNAVEDRLDSEASDFNIPLDDYIDEAVDGGEFNTEDE